MKTKTKLLMAGVDYISNNSASTFRACPFKFDIAYRQGIKPIKTAVSLYFGVKMHEALDYAYSNSCDVEMVIEYFETVFMGGLDEEPVAWSVNTTRKDGGDFKDPETACEYGKAMLKAYFQNWEEENRDWKVLASETDFEVEIKKGSTSILYTGIIDKIVDIRGGIWGVDHKFMAQAMDKDLLQVENQITGYYVGAKKLGYDLDGFIFDVGYKLKTPKFERVPVFRTKEQINDFIDNTLGTIEAIKQGAKYQNISRECKTCHYKGFCFNNKQLGDNYYQEA